MLAAGSRRLEITSSKMGGVTLAPAEVICCKEVFRASVVNASISFLTLPALWVRAWHLHQRDTFFVPLRSTKNTRTDGLFCCWTFKD